MSNRKLDDLRRGPDIIPGGGKKLDDAAPEVAKTIGATVKDTGKSARSVMHIDPEGPDYVGFGD